MGRRKYLTAIIKNIGHREVLHPIANSNISGYSLIRQFYAPNYGSYNAANERKDLRTTLYWNPQVVTTPQRNKILLSFYNNDVSKKFRVIIEGMSKDGRLVHLEQIME